MVQISQRRLCLIPCSAWTDTRRWTERMFRRVEHRHVKLLLLLLLLIRLISSYREATRWRVAADQVLLRLRRMRRHGGACGVEWLTITTSGFVGRRPQMIVWLLLLLLLLSCAHVLQHGPLMITRSRTARTHTHTRPLFMAFSVLQSVMKEKTRERRVKGRPLVINQYRHEHSSWVLS